MYINDFPSEILEEIFLRFVSPSKVHLSASPFISSRRSPASPYVISKICKRWRHVALKLAHLWTHLHVVDPRNVSIVQHLEEWMSRAGTLPLCLSLRQYGFYDEQASIAVATLFLNSLHRCQSFEMVIRTPLEDFGLKNFERDPSTPLESLNVWCKDSLWADAELLTNLLLNTRSLRTIRWSCALGPLDGVSRSWGNLRELSITGTRTLANFLSALSHCQNLESLEIRQSLTDDVVLQSVILPRLTHLSISVLFGWPKKILPSLILPALAELELVAFQELEWNPVLDLIQRSGVMLRRLSITSNSFSGHLYVDPVNLTGILKMPYFRALRVLEVEAPMAGLSIIEFLTLPTSSSTGVGDENEGTAGYLVHLEKISLIFGDTRAMQISPALPKLIKSRLGKTHNLKPVSEYLKIKTHIHFSLSIPSK